MAKAIISRKEMIGKKFNRLLVLKHSHTTKAWSQYYLCKCECGKITTVGKQKLFNGLTKSCGCYKKEDIVNRSKKHGQYKTKEYAAWVAMQTRCYNQKTHNFRNYGGRGITVYSQWIGNFDQFLKDVGPSPTVEHSLDRINNNGNYEPGNVKWSTTKEQARNKSTNFFITINGETKIITEWCMLLKVSRRCLKYRLERKIPFNDLIEAAGISP